MVCHDSEPELKISSKIFEQTGQEVKRYIYTLKDAKRYMKAANATQYIISFWFLPFLKKNIRISY